MACSSDLLGETRPMESHVVGLPARCRRVPGGVSVVPVARRQPGPRSVAARSAAEGAMTAVAAKPASARWVSLYPESATANVVLGARTSRSLWARACPSARW